MALLVCGGLFFYRNQVEAEKEKEILARQAEIQAKLEKLAPEDIAGKDTTAYARAVAILTTEIAKALNGKGLFDNHRVAITGFKDAESEEYCKPLTISLRQRVRDDAFKIASLVGCNLTGDPRANFETIENEIIFSGKGEVQIDLDAVKHLGDPDILITGTWQNEKNHYYLTLTAYQRAPSPTERDVGTDETGGGKKRVEVFTIVTSTGRDVPKEKSLRSELLDCIEDTKKKPPRQIVGASASTGFLRIESEPAGSNVSLNGVEKGTTPLSLDNIQPGAYRVAVGRSGYERVLKSRSRSSGNFFALTVRSPFRRPATAPLNLLF